MRQQHQNLALLAGAVSAWHNSPNRELWTEADGFRLTVQICGDGTQAARFTVLRRQYGAGSPFALVGEAVEADVKSAMHAAERMAGRIEAEWQAGRDVASGTSVTAESVVLSTSK